MSYHPRERRVPKPLPPATIESVVAETIKLARYVDSLDKSMVRLYERITPFREGPLVRQRDEEPEDAQLRATPLRALKILASSERRLEEIEARLAIATSLLDQISNDSWSRAEMKKYLDGEKS